jgi:uncharacterized protein (TIGR02145 family)
MKIFVCLLVLTFTINDGLAQHKTLTLYYPNDSTNVISISNLDSMSIFICGVSKVNYGGKYYNTVLIGNQCWLKENLDIGNMINSTSEGFQQSNNGITEKYCYNNNPANCETYGGLYEWPEAMQYSTTPGTQGICPSGWHIPTLAEFQTLISTVGGNGNALKAIGQGSGGGAGTNTSGFSALLAGYRYYNGNFGYLSTSTTFWSSTEYSSTHAYSLLLYSTNSSYNFYYYYKEGGFSVRCLKD